tara:strand:+ start:558 stop:686 length:129 start_codon:yes stop_codon:yes gene_type:complete
MPNLRPLKDMSKSFYHFVVSGMKNLKKYKVLNWNKKLYPWKR